MGLSKIPKKGPNRRFWRASFWYFPVTIVVLAAILAAGLDVAREFDPKHFAKSPSMLRWARANGGFRSEEETFAAAAFGGDWETLRFLVKDRCRWDSRTCREAARGGHADVLKWARSEGCGVVDEETFAAAAESGDWPTLRFLRAEGYRWDAETCAAAAQHGHLDVLRWARENGCEWNKKTCEHAAGHGHLEILKYAATNGCEAGVGAVRPVSAIVTGDRSDASVGTSDRADSPTAWPTSAMRGGAGISRRPESASRVKRSTSG